jgi:hypothetical protein
MAPDQSALLELLGDLKLTDVNDRIRVATETLYQEPIDAEAAAFIGAAPSSAHRIVLRRATASGCGPWPRPPVSLSCGSKPAAGFVLSVAAGTPPPGRSGVVRSRDGGICPRRLDTRKVDDLVKALGADTGISTSEVRICGNLDEDVTRSGTGRSRTPRTRMCSSTRRTAKPGSAGGWSPKPWSSRSASPLTGRGEVLIEYIARNDPALTAGDGRLRPVPSFAEAAERQCTE